MDSAGWSSAEPYSLTATDDRPELKGMVLQLRPALATADLEAKSG
jgi:hypothetical protein